MRDARNVDYLENACFKTSELFLIFSLNILDNEEVYFFLVGVAGRKEAAKILFPIATFFF